MHPKNSPPGSHTCTNSGKSLLTSQEKTIVPSRWLQSVVFRATVHRWRRRSTWEHLYWSTEHRSSSSQATRIFWNLCRFSRFSRTRRKPSWNLLRSSWKLYWRWNNFSKSVQKTKLKLHWRRNTVQQSPETSEHSNVVKSTQKNWLLQVM